MLVSRWWLIGLLAVVAITIASPTEDSSSAVLINGELYDESDEFLTEADLSDSDEDDIVFVDENGDEDGEFSRGIGKVIGKGIKKGGKVLIKGGKKVIKIAGKGLKKIGKGAGKGLKLIGKGAKKGMIKIAKGSAKGLLKGAKLAGKGVIKVSRATKKFITKKGTKIWKGLKEQWKGELGKAAKKLMKAVGEQVLEVGVSIAVEAIAPMVVEYVMQETQDRLCDCEAFTCSCCAQPPGFEKGCLVIRVRPNKKFLNAAVTYNGKELAKVNITSEEEAESCKKLDGLARFVTACIDPLGMGELENGFRGCLNINIEPLKIERQMCVDFTGTFKNGTAKWVPVNELDEIEIAVEGAEEE